MTYLDLSPSLSADKPTLYSSLKTTTEPLKFLLQVLAAVSQGMGQVAIVIDRIELLSMVLGQDNVLIFVKEVKAMANAFPFYAHIDTSLIAND